MVYAGDRKLRTTTAVCVVRCEISAEQTLFTVVTSRDIDVEVDAGSSRDTVRTVRVTDAVEVVRHFLEEVASTG